MRPVEAGNQVANRVRPSLSRSEVATSLPSQQSSLAGAEVAGFIWNDGQSAT